MTDNNTLYKSKFVKLVWVQLIIIFVGVVSLFYITVEIDEKFEEYKRIVDLKKEAEVQYNNLKANIEKLYAVKVTQENDVYELKATAKALGYNTSDGKPVYNFKIYVNSSSELLAKLDKVTYDFNHPTFRQPHREVIDRSNKFSVQYDGWGCLNNVVVKVYLKEGTIQTINFNMCKSIGWN